MSTFPYSSSKILQNNTVEHTCTDKSSVAFVFLALRAHCHARSYKTPDNVAGLKHLETHAPLHLVFSKAKFAAARLWAARPGVRGMSLDGAPGVGAAEGVEGLGSVFLAGTVAFFAAGAVALTAAALDAGGLLVTASMVPRCLDAEPRCRASMPPRCRLDASMPGLWPIPG